MNNNFLSTILLIEDDPGDALLLQEILEQHGCKARLATVERLAEGISCLQQNHCDIVLLDMHLPDSPLLSGRCSSLCGKGEWQEPG
ncbi:MAG: response regulator [Desulfoarculaceae bacterium]|nr:response regulator [Desulfoarculaceae bacterium]